MVSSELRAILIAITLGACDGCRNPPPPAQEQYEVEELAPRIFEEDPNAEHVEVSPISDMPPPSPEPPPPPIAPATHTDDDYSSDATIEARRLVYRVRMFVPEGLGPSSGSQIALPAAELYIDVAQDRLRARFAGPGWPVQAGSEVRLRRDFPGVYLFDGRGGRPLVPGELASFFEGGHVSRRGPPLRVFPIMGFRRADEAGSPGELVCALLAEWGGEPWENVMRRCERGPPPQFRLGYWRAEQTASVPIDLPRSSLRADEHTPPHDVTTETSRALFEPAAMSRIPPSGRGETPADDADGFVVDNESSTRVMVIVSGVTIGWVDAAASARFDGLVPGGYEVMMMRPLGAVVQRYRDITLPGAVRVCDGRCRPQPPAP